MAWNLEQAANDLERYLIRREQPADGAVEIAISKLREPESTCSEGYDFETSMYGSDARLAEIGELVAAKKPIGFLDVTYVPERMCNAEQDYDAMDNGIPDCRIWKCSCGKSFPFWRGLNPCFCPNCGAKVVE